MRFGRFQDTQNTLFEFNLIQSDFRNANLVAENIGRLPEKDAQTLYQNLEKMTNSAVEISKLNLEGFSRLIWEKLSYSEFGKSESLGLNEIEQTNRKFPQEFLIFDSLKSLTALQGETMLNFLFVGDFEAIGKYANQFSNNVQIPGKITNWMGFCSDPHTINSTNLSLLRQTQETPTDLSLTQLYREYDKNIDHWLVGEDGSGLLTRENIKWLSKREDNVVFGLIESMHYLDHSETNVNLYYRLMIACISACKISGTVIIEIPLPLNGALLALYSIFSHFFESSKIIRYDNYPRDNQLVFLHGSNLLVNMSERFAENLDIPQMNSLLAGLDGYDPRLEYLDAESSVGVTEWIKKIHKKWIERGA